MIEVFGYTFGVLSILAVVGVCVIAIVVGTMYLVSRDIDED